jgi:hypothetical protein
MPPKNNKMMPPQKRPQPQNRTAVSNKVIKSPNRSLPSSPRKGNLVKQLKVLESNSIDLEEQMKKMNSYPQSLEDFINMVSVTKAHSLFV